MGPSKLQGALRLLVARDVSIRHCVICKGVWAGWHKDGGRLRKRYARSRQGGDTSAHMSTVHGTVTYSRLALADTGGGGCWNVPWPSLNFEGEAMKRWKPAKSSQATLS
ncbi:hypothetical protein AN958_00642 [Leucoagaricus sp. SymC.cos]|nr:hypothetical protein AN958_00642 [Leucoagaricus sp. SymC.cos]